MSRLLTCISTEHDYRLVLLAVLVCAGTVVTAFRIYRHALAITDALRWPWIVLSGVATATGIWATHFVAMLAYRPDISIGYDLATTVASLLVAALATTGGFAVSASGRRAHVLLGGTTIGLGIGAMHFTGMAALELSGRVLWDGDVALFALAVGVVLTAAALDTFHRLDRRLGQWVASALLVAAISGLHFTAMTAASIASDPAIAIGASRIDRTALAITVASVTAVVLIAGLIAIFLAELNDELERRTRLLRAEAEENRRTQAEIEAQRRLLVAHQTTIAELMGTAAIRAGTPRQAMHALCRALSRDLAMDRVGTWLLAADQASFWHREVYDAASDTFVSPPVTATTAFVEAMIRASGDRLVAVDDTSVLPHALDGLQEMIYRPIGIRSILHAPIMADGRPIGYITCGSVGSRTRWSAEHKLFTAGIANLAALVIERHERQKIEADLRLATEAAAAANRAKSLFLANMSHEIRTPMNGVFGMTELLSRTDLSDRQRRLVSTISQSARTLLTIINDILDISRIEEGKLELDRHEFELHSSVEDAVALMADEAQKKGLDLSLYIDERAVATITGDSVRLRQVLINLIGNAVKFTATGEVAVRVAAVEGSAVAEADRSGAAQGGAAERVRFEVLDTGIGIAPDVLAHLFKPFVQADSSISRRFGGTGLGLSISRHLVGLMGGEMAIESTPGTGTRISFVLPVERRAPAEAPRLGEAARGLAGTRILVVDDRETNREIVCSYLAAAGAQPEAADGAAQALAMLARAAEKGKPFALAIVDLVMPGVDGLELCRRIRSHEAFGRLPLMVLSSLSWSGAPGAVREAGIACMLAKPVRRFELLGKVMELLGRRTAAAHAGGEPQGERPSALSRTRVLVAEDNPVNQAVVDEYLANLGCTLTMVENGLHAVAAFEREAFDVVLMDCQMPEMDGLTATRRLRAYEAERGLRRTPIVALTANAFEEDRLACLAAGMDDYLSKPFSEAQLAALLMRWSGAGRDAGMEGTSPAIGVTVGDAGAGDAGPARRPVVAPAAATPATAPRLPARTPLRPDLEAKLQAIYRDYAPGAAATLARSLARSDCVAMKLAAHSLKSSSANVGQSEVAEACRLIEIAAATGDTAACRPLVVSIEKALAALAAPPATDAAVATDAAA